MRFARYSAMQNERIYANLCKTQVKETKTKAAAPQVSRSFSRKGNTEMTVITIYDVTFPTSRKIE